jgi:hypothetical protein
MKKFEFRNFKKIEIPNIWNLDLEMEWIEMLKKFENPNIWNLEKFEISKLKSGSANQSTIRAKVYSVSSSLHYITFETRLALFLASVIES